MKSASGGETRRGLKIITVSGESLPPAPPRSRHIDYRIPFPPFSLTGHVALSHSSRLLVSRGDLGSSLRAGLYAGTPVQPDCCAFSGNCSLGSNPEKDTTKRHWQQPLVKVMCEIFREYLKWLPECGYTRRTILVTRLA